MNQYPRQWFGEHAQVGLESQSLFIDKYLTCKDTINAWQQLNELKAIAPKTYITRQGARILNASTFSKQKLGFFFDGFWPDYSPDKSLIWAIFIIAASHTQAILDIVCNPEEAEIVIKSCFPLITSPFRSSHCTQVLYLGENVRPSYFETDYSFTTDRCSYLGRNSYLPVWLDSLYSANYCKVENLLQGKWIHDYFYGLSSKWLSWQDRAAKIAYIGNNKEPLRMSIIHFLRVSGFEVDIFGSQSRPVSSKFDVYNKYRFVLCPENSFYPGYITEKLIDAVGSGAVALYWGGADSLLVNSLGDRIISINAYDLDGLLSSIATHSGPTSSIAEFVNILSTESHDVVNKAVKTAEKILLAYIA